VSSPVIPRRLPLFCDVFRLPFRPPPSPAVLFSYLSSPGRSCLRSWGSSSLLMTAVLGIQGRGRTTFCRPVSSWGLGSPPAGPYGGPGRLRTPTQASIETKKANKTKRLPGDTRPQCVILQDIGYRESYIITA